MFIGQLEHLSKYGILGSINKQILPSSISFSFYILACRKNYMYIHVHIITERERGRLRERELRATHIILLGAPWSRSQEAELGFG